MELTLTKPGTLTQAEWTAIQQFYGAFDRHEPEVLDQVLTEDWTDIPAQPGEHKGPDGARFVMQGLLKSFPDLRADIKEILGGEHAAAARVELSGTHTGDFLGIPATGRKVSFALHEFHRFRDGRIMQTYNMEDAQDLFRQLGSYPPGTP